MHKYRDVLSKRHGARYKNGKARHRKLTIQKNSKTAHCHAMLKYVLRPVYICYTIAENPTESPREAATNSLMQQSSSVSSSKLATVTLAQIVASRRRNIHHRTTVAIAIAAAAAATITTTCRCRFSDVRLRFTTPRAIVLSDISIIHRHPLPHPVSVYYYPRLHSFYGLRTRVNVRPVTRRTPSSR